MTAQDVLSFLGSIDDREVMKIAANTICELAVRGFCPRCFMSIASHADVSLCYRILSSHSGDGCPEAETWASKHFTVAVMRSAACLEDSSKWETFIPSDAPVGI